MSKGSCYTQIDNVGANNRYKIVPPYPSTVKPKLFQVMGEPSYMVSNSNIKDIVNTHNCYGYKTWNKMSCNPENNQEIVYDANYFKKPFPKGFNDVSK